MTRRTTLLRSLHDVGLAVWFGGAPAGAADIDGAVADLPDPTDRLRVVTVSHGEQQRPGQQLSGIPARPGRLVGSVT